MKQQRRMFGAAVLIVTLMVCLETVACRLPVPFDSAFECAELVVQGDVVEMWDPFEKDSRKVFSRHRCYRLKVQKCCKGGLEPGAEVLFWDRHFGSTASYGIRSKGEYIIYLQPASLSEYEAKFVNPDGGSFYRPTRVRFSGGPTADSFARELRLIDLVVENPPADKRKAYRQLLENDSDAVFLSYIVKDWPRPCTNEDLALFKEKVMAGKGKELYVRRMLGELLNHPGALTDADVAVLLQKGGIDTFDSLRPLITDRNIGALRALLFDFLRDTGAAGPFRQLIEKLSALDPDYFRERLVASHDFPLWKLIPCLKALDMNGSDLGMADFPEEVLSVRHNQLYEISKILEGDLFWVSYPLRYPSNCKGMREALPLLEPVLKQKDSPVRRACVALFRTYGVPLESTGGIYVPHYSGAPASCPVKLEIRMERSTYKLGEEIKFILKESATVDDINFCFEGKALTTLHFEGHWHSPEFLDQKVWDNVAVSREQFSVLKKGISQERELKLFRSIDRPGTYRIELKKCYLHDGGEHGLDAWTGVVSADNELVFTVEGP